MRNGAHTPLRSLRCLANEARWLAATERQHPEVQITSGLHCNPLVLFLKDIFDTINDTALSSNG